MSGSDTGQVRPPFFRKTDILIWAKIPLEVSKWLDREARKVKAPMTQMGRSRYGRARKIRVLIAAMERSKQKGT